MASHSNSTAEPQVPVSMLKERRQGWHAFTRFIVMNCLAVATILLLMLVFLRIL